MSDDIDRRVADIKETNNTRVCPKCGTRMEKQKRKCVNETCGVSLNSAEKESRGEDILGTAIIEEPSQQVFRRKESQVMINVDKDDKLVQKTVDVSRDVEMEWSHVPTGHPAGAMKVTVSDPVFENPSSYHAVAEVLRRVGHACKVTRYGFSGQESREWISLTMDGLPYGLCIEVIKSTFMCPLCIQKGGENKVSFFDKEWNEHVKKEHGGVM